MPKLTSGVSITLELQQWQRSAAKGRMTRFDQPDSIVQFHGDPRALDRSTNIRSQDSCHPVFIAIWLNPCTEASGDEAIKRSH